MKKFYWLPAAALALMLGACSSDDIVPGAEGTGPQWNADGKGYVSLAVNLPQERSTMNRAANDQFDDGDPSEYDVNGAVLVIFAGDNEASATFSGAYDLDINNIEGVDDNPNQITSTVRLTQAINAVASDDNLYALVILNPGNLITVGEDNSLSLNGAQLLPATSTGGNTGSTFADFQAATMTMANGDVSSITSTTNGFLMLNAPLASKKGNGWSSPTAGTVSTLTPLDGQVYATAAEAESHPAAEVYVERAVAKVTVTASNTTGNLDGTATGGGNEGGSSDSGNSGDGTDNQNAATTRAWEIKGWVLNNTNTKSYLVRNANTSDTWWGYRADGLTGDADYRFIGTSEVATGAGYRTYWGKDPNYSAKVDNDLYAPWYEGNNPTADNLTALDKSLYCLENTFDVTHQNQDETTTVIVAAQFNNGNDFYTLRGVTTTFYDSDALTKAVKNAFLHDPVVEAAIQANLAESKSFGADDIQSITYDNDGAGRWHVTGITYANTAASKFKDSTIPEVLAAPSGEEQSGGTAYEAGIANADGLNIECYDGGMSYYPVLIKHFGDDLTPWTSADVEGGVSYPGTNGERDWLGRYGVLRNNWYQINVTKISNLGSATVPEITGPNDPTNSYISVQINVLSWAKRTQNVDL